MAGTITNGDSGRHVGHAKTHFTALLIALLLLFLVAPLMWLVELRWESHWPGTILTGVLSLDILFAAVVAARSTRERIVARCMAIVSVVAYQIANATSLSAAWPVAHILGIVFLGYVIVIVLRFVFTAKSVSWNTVSASLCVYVLFSVAFALLYAMLFLVDNGSFSFSNERVAASPSGARFLITSLYYSLVTMTTLGYGDIVPTTPVTQIAAAVQAVVGQLYIAVLVARLVGMHAASSMSAGQN